MQVFSASLSPTIVGPQTTSEQGFTVTGLLAGTAVIVNCQSPTPNLAILGCRVSAANVLAINFANPTTASITPPTATYLVAAFHTLIGTAGSNVYQAIDMESVDNIDLTNELRATLTGNSMIAGG